MLVYIKATWNSVGCCGRVRQDLAILHAANVFVRCLCNPRLPRSFKMVVLRAAANLPTAVAFPHCFCYMGAQGARLVQLWFIWGQ